MFRAPRLRKLLEVLLAKLDNTSLSSKNGLLTKFIPRFAWDSLSVQYLPYVAEYFSAYAQFSCFFVCDYAMVC